MGETGMDGRELPGRDVRPGAAARAAGPEPEPDMGFEEFLKLLYSDAVARNDAEWIRWYEGWLRNMPKDNPEAYIEKCRMYFMERVQRSIDKDIERGLDERIGRNIEEWINRQIMVENFEDFEREYASMMILRSC